MNYKENYYKFHNLDICDPLFCIMCNKLSVNLHHVIYKSKGGSDDPENLVPMCYECHSGHHERNKPTTNEIKMKFENKKS